jgi:hypothetical protein
LSSALNRFVDFVSLVYHEGRYARGLPAGSTRIVCQKLIDYFANDFDRQRAWKKIQPIRQTALVAYSATRAEEIFKQRFSVSLEQLRVLFMDPCFEGKAVGGKRWASIVTKVIDVRNKLDERDEHAAEQILREIAQTMHNTRTCGQKLFELDSKLFGH